MQGRTVTVTILYVRFDRILHATWGVYRAYRKEDDHSTLLSDRIMKMCVELTDAAHPHLTITPLSMHFDRILRMCGDLTDVAHSRR